MRNIFIFIALAVFWSSCSSDFFNQVVEIDPPEYQKQLVVYAFNGSLDSNFRAQVTRSVGLLEVIDDTAFYVKKASVELYEDGQLKAKALESTINPKGWYETMTDPGLYQPGKTYELKVTHPDYPIVTARQTMPYPVMVDSVRLRQNGGVSPDGISLFAIDVFLKDRPNEKNYYAIEVNSLYYYTLPRYDNTGMIIGYDTIFNQQRVYPYGVDDPNVELTDRQILISDQFFDGQAYKFSFKSDYFQSETIYDVHVRAVTEDYYLYAISQQRQLDSEDFPLSEPVIVHGNLTNGIGDFCLYSEQQFAIK